MQRSQSREKAPATNGSWLDGQALRSPIAQIDLFLVITRWLAIWAIGVMSLLKGFSGDALLPL